MRNSWTKLIIEADGKDPWYESTPRCSYSQYTIHRMQSMIELLFLSIEEAKTIPDSTADVSHCFGESTSSSLYILLVCSSILSNSLHFEWAYQGIHDYHYQMQPTAIADTTQVYMYMYIYKGRRCRFTSHL